MGRIQKIQKRDTLRNRSILRGLVVALLLAVLLSSCATTYKRVRPDKEKVLLDSVQTEIPEPLLFDVRIQTFDLGELPSSENESRGISKEIRQAESKYMAVQLKHALYQTGYWGSVRVVPAESSGDEVRVTGRILKSNGEELKLKIVAFDAVDRQWFEKDFKGAVNEQRYKESSGEQVEVFQNVYYQIANELAAYYKAMTQDQILEVRQVSEMRFAKELVPSAFTGYLQKDKKTGRFIIDRLPSEDDEMLARVRRVRERDYMLVDTLDVNYEGLHRDMKEVYTNWRKSRLLEMNMIREVDDAKNKELVKGSLLVLSGAALGVLYGQSKGYNPAIPAIVGAAVGAGVAKMFEADKIKEEAEINKAALEELGVSFAAEVEPTVLKVEGETIELTGSAEAKYEQWREVLGKIYQVETGAETFTK
jgi:hypothetical protein